MCSHVCPSVVNVLFIPQARGLTPITEYVNDVDQYN